MPLKEILTKEVVSCRLADDIKTVAQIMKRDNVGAVLVLDEMAKPVGIVTDRDIVLRCIAGDLGVMEKVDRIMTKTLVLARVDQGIQDVIRLMKVNKIRRIPVVDQMGKATGLVSFGDIVGLLAKELGEISAATPFAAAA